VSKISIAALMGLIVVAAPKSVPNDSELSTHLGQLGFESAKPRGFDRHGSSIRLDPVLGDYRCDA
jgi:hypothetical protein